MKKTVLVLVFALVGAGSAIPASAETGQPRLDRVREWNGLALDAARATRATDADAARLYAMLNVAVYDAVNGLSGGAAGRSRPRAGVRARARGAPTRSPRRSPPRTPCWSGWTASGLPRTTRSSPPTSPTCARATAATPA